VNAGGSAMPRRLILAEQFGPTVQGEGPSAGQLAVFVRLSRCNLSCNCATLRTRGTGGITTRVRSPAGCPSGT
jgi:7-carboxy-7-deazaguanine synthase